MVNGECSLKHTTQPDKCDRFLGTHYVYHRRPSTMMMWYPKLVLTSDETMGLSTVDGVRANAASWKAPTMLPLTIHPKLPPAVQLSDDLHPQQSRPTFGFIFGVFLSDLIESLALLGEESRLQKESRGRGKVDI